MLRSTYAVIHLPALLKNIRYAKRSLKPDTKFLAVIKANAKKTGFFDKCRYLISDYRSYIRKAGGRDTWDIIFIDPPYGLHLVGDAVERILRAGIAAPGCLLICESGEEEIFAGKEELHRQFPAQPFGMDRRHFIVGAVMHF